MLYRLPVNRRYLLDSFEDNEDYFAAATGSVNCGVTIGSHGKQHDMQIGDVLQRESMHSCEYPMLAI